MKKFLSLSLAVMMALSMAACGNNESQSSSESSSSVSNPAEKITINVAGLKGPTAMGMVKLMEDAEAETTTNTYKFTLAGAPDELTGKIVQGEFDIACVPTNLAATLYKKTEGKVQLAALNTLGVLYIVENGETIQSVEDLRGKTIWATGAGATPEFALNYILEQNGLTVGTDVTVEYKTEHAELAQALAADQAQIALLPQPFVTSVLTQNDTVRVALDLTAEWDKATDGASSLTMGCVIVQKQFAEENPEALKAFMDEYAASVTYVNDAANLEAAAALCEKFDIIKAAVAQKALPACNIVFVTGEEMKSTTAGFLEVLFNANPASVGGVLPDDGFYYLG